MSIIQQKNAPKKGTISLTTPKREPLPRTWFLSRGYKKADPAYTNGRVLWLHPETNDVLNQYGQKMALKLLPKEKYGLKCIRYLALSRTHGDMYLARLKYLTFIGPIPEGYTIDHIDGNTLNNATWNLRTVPDKINRRDGGFLKKLRNHGINVAMYHTDIILKGYERMAKWKALHTEWKYRCLTRTDLLQIFLGPDFHRDPRSTDDIMLAEMSRHQEI
jgi:hypothetical protein